MPSPPPHLAPHTSAGGKPTQRPPGRSAITWTIPPDRRRAAVDTLLAALPDWFGIPENNRRYAAAAAENPTALLDRDVGALTLTRPAPYTADIHLLAIHPDHHRQGHGRRLVEAAKDRARTEGARFLTVRTLGPSDPSPRYAQTRAFYEAIGFTALAELHVWNDGRPMQLYARSL